MISKSQPFYIPVISQTYMNKNIIHNENNQDITCGYGVSGFAGIVLILFTADLSVFIPSPSSFTFSVYENFVYDLSFICCIF